MQRVSEVCRDEQVRARNMIAEMRHPVAGPVFAAGNPIKMSDWTHETHAPAPRLGEHTDDVLRSVAGYDDARVAALRARGVIA